MVDPIEQAALPQGHYRIGDGHATGVLHLDTRAARQRWREHFSRLHETACEHLQRAGARVMMVSTDADPVRALSEVLRGVGMPGQSGAVA
jgi:hypothetical protein